MNRMTRRLADFAVAVRYEDLPPPVIQRAKDCITDTVGAIIYGADLPWSKMIIAYARANGSGGNSFTPHCRRPGGHSGVADPAGKHTHPVRLLPAGRGPQRQPDR